MTFQFNTYSFFFSIFAIVIVFFLAAVIWGRRPAPGSVPFTLFLLVVIVWIFIRTFMVAAVDISTKVPLAKLIYIFTAASSIMWLAFALDCNGSKWWRRPRNLVLLFIIPAITGLILLINRPEINAWLGLNVNIDESAGIVVWQKGPFTWFQTIFIGSILLAGSILLFRAAFSSHTEQRWKKLVILLGTLIPIVSHAISTIGYYPVEGLDLTPLALTLAGIIYATTVFSFHFLDIVPVARSVLIEKIPDGILVLNSEGSIADMNQAAGWMMGLSDTSVIGKSLETVCPWLRRLMPDVEHGRKIELIPAVTGSGLFLDVSVIPLAAPGNTIAGQLIILKNISERKKAEEALKASEEKYRGLVNNIQLGVFRVTQQGKHLEVNKAMEDITGYSREELLSMDVKDLYVHPEDREALLDGSKTATERTSNEVWHKKKDGTPIMAAVTITPVRNSGGNLIYYDGILEDITERVKLADKNRELYEKEKGQRQELEAEAQARGLFINTLGHELRTPLTPIVVSAESLKVSFDRDPESMESKLIHNVYNGAQVLLQRLNELLTLGKFSRGEICLQIESVDINNLIKGVISHLKPVMQIKKQELVLEMGGEYPPLQADPFLLDPVFSNLLSTASRLSPEGGKVYLSVKAADNGVLVAVRDEGKGISAEEQERLFQPYHRVEQDRARFQGLGLGLAISKQIIDAHQGKIWLTSQPGKGSIFSFWLPIKPSMKQIQQGSTDLPCGPVC